MTTALIIVLAWYLIGVATYIWMVTETENLYVKDIGPTLLVGLAGPILMIILISLIWWPKIANKKLFNKRNKTTDDN